MKIRETFLHLMDEKKQISKITVTELTRRCDIDRSTFYAYYSDIYSIAEEEEERLLDEFFNGIDLRQPFDIHAYFHGIIEEIRSGEDTYRILLTCEEPLRFMEVLRQKEEDLFCRFYLKTPRSGVRKQDITFFTYGMVNMLVAYLKGTAAMTLEELEAELNRWMILLIMTAEETAPCEGLPARGCSDGAAE